MVDEIIMREGVVEDLMIGADIVMVGGGDTMMVGLGVAGTMRIEAVVSEGVETRGMGADRTSATDMKLEGTGDPQLQQKSSRNPVKKIWRDDRS